MEDMQAPEPLLIHLSSTRHDMTKASAGGEKGRFHARARESRKGLARESRGRDQARGDTSDVVRSELELMRCSICLDILHNTAAELTHMSLLEQPDAAGLSEMRSDVHSSYRVREHELPCNKYVYSV